MSRRIRLTKSTQKIKEEQINFLLEDCEKSLEYKKAIEIKDMQSIVLYDVCSQSINQIVSCSQYVPFWFDCVF